MANLTPRRDDRTYEQLAEALRRQLPGEWTDHNASDPGIMLLELLAWLGEMALYRMERVPDAHENKFLNLLIDPPEPVTVTLEFTASFDPAPATASISIPAGTLLATDFVGGRRVVFETYQTVVLRRPAVSPLTDTRSTRARAIFEVRDEPLGISDGRPDQVFDLRPPRIALGIADSFPAPILTDFAHRTSAYEPNPRVEVAGTEWTAEPSLLTERSRVQGTELGERYMVDGPASQIRFGDGTFGAIPPVGAIISCSRYAVLQGNEALRVGENDVTHLLTLTPPADVILSVTNTEAEGGANFFDLTRRTELGLRAFGAPYRLITERDFERVILTEFNDFQEQAGDARRIARTGVLFNRRTPLDSTGQAPGYVTVVFIAGDSDAIETQMRRTDLTVSAKQGVLAAGSTLWPRLRRFLDPRRLITTRLEHEAPALTGITVAATIAVAPDRNLGQMHDDLRERVYAFLSLLRGDFDGRGWRIGRGVYRSQLFRLLEDADGVDHVISLALAPGDTEGNVIVEPHELPVVQSLSLSIVRA